MRDCSEDKAEMHGRLVSSDGKRGVDLEARQRKLSA